MGLTVDNWFSHGFNLFEANDCHRGTSNHEAHIDNEEKVKKLVSQRTLGESPMRNLKKKVTRGEYIVLFADKGIGIVFLFSANFGNFLVGAMRRQNIFKK